MSDLSISHFNRVSFWRSEEHTSELQSRLHLVCRLLLEKKKTAYHPHAAVLVDDALALTDNFPAHYLPPLYLVQCGGLGDAALHVWMSHFVVDSLRVYLE